MKQSHISAKKAVLFSVILTCCVLLIAELTLRVWAYYYRTPYERYNTHSGRLELVPNTHIIREDGKEFLINSKGFIGPEFSQRKSQGVYRVFALGDSCTFGYWKERYPAILEQLLNSDSSLQKFEIINAGIEGYNSEHALARLNDIVARYEPDMVTIYIGWNDLMKVNPNGLSSAGKYAWLARFMQRSYLIKAYRKVMFFYLRPLIMKPRLVSDESEGKALDQFVPVAFQMNLEKMVELLQERNIQPLLFTLPTVASSGMNYAELQRQRVFFPYYAGMYSVEKFLSLHQSYNNVIRKTASVYGVPLVDLDTIFNKYDKTELFWDTMHPSNKGHRLIAQSVFTQVDEVVQQLDNGIGPR